MSPGRGLYCPGNWRHHDEKRHAESAATHPLRIVRFSLRNSRCMPSFFAFRTSSYLNNCRFYARTIASLFHSPGAGKQTQSMLLGVSGQRKALPGGRGKAGLLLERLGKQKRYISMIQTGRGVFLNQMCASFKIDCLSYTANYTLREVFCGPNNSYGDFGC